jgi:hypothetical protein
MHLHAYNPQAQTHGVETGGLFINWKMDDPTQTNATRPGPDGNVQHDHDPQVDLLYLTALAQYRHLHPQERTFDTDLDQMTALVSTDFHRYSLPKGWIYFYLLKNGLLLHNAVLMNEAQMVASNFYRDWYDPVLGFVYDRVHTPGDYRTNDSLQAGAALIEAGQRWNQPDWIKAGEQTLEHVIAVGLDGQSHLFYNSLIVSSDGHDQIQNAQAKPATQGEAVDALLTASTLTQRHQYLEVASQVLQSLWETSGLWDKARGGFFFALDLSKGQLITDYKETRSQTLTLISVHHYNQVKQQQFAHQEQQLVAVLTDHFYQRSYHGFTYRLSADFHIYQSRAGAGIGVEDYFTSEAMGSALDALQQTELVP